MWAERIDAKFRDLAPRLVKTFQGRTGDYLVCEDIGAPLTQFCGAGKSGQELLDHEKKGAAALPASARDPGERLKDQDLDGVSAEVLYASCGMMWFSLSDPQLRAAIFRAFNDWSADYSAHCRDRLLGTGLITLEDIPASVAELTRLAKRGLRGVMIQGYPPDELPYSSVHYDPFWAAAQDLDIPISLHIFTARRSELDATRALQTYIQGPHFIQLTLADMAFGGVFEKFPRLKVVSAENDVSWLPHFLYRLDHGYDKFRKFSGVDLELKPSEYLKRQVYATFVFEDGWIDIPEQHGFPNLMWSSDYPHADSTWPGSRQYIADHFGRARTPTLAAVLAENATHLYGLRWLGRT
jgi:predicted TIM-barrel fold metal-dependent hydrolase